MLQTCTLHHSKELYKSYNIPDKDYEPFFLSNDLELALITLGQIYDTPSGHKQSYCKVTTFNDSPLEILIIKLNDYNKILNSLFQVPRSCQIAMGENHDKPSGRKQSLSEVGSFNVSPSEKYDPNTNIAHFLSVTLNLTK